MKEVDFVEKEDDGRRGEPLGIARIVEQRQTLL